MASNGFICAHKLLSYFLLPVKILITLPFFFIAIFVIALSNYGVLPKDLAYYILRGVVLISNAVYGINIHIIEDKAYRNYQLLSASEQYVIVYNHINIMDPFILANVINDYMSFVAFKDIIKFPPFAFITNFLNVIKVDRSKRTETTKKIGEYIKTSKHKLCIAPDQCRHFEKNENIASFKTGSFANKNKVLPVLIRYVPSFKSECFNWSHPDNYDKSFLTHMKELLLDGNIDVYVKFLDLQKYDENKFSNCSDYSEDVRTKMSNELKKLPDQNKSQLENIEETNLNCIFFITFISLGICCIALLFGDFEGAFHMISLSFSGFLFHSFPTNSTLLFDRLFVIYAIQKVLFFKNTQTTNLIKYCLAFFAIMNWIKNMNDDTNKDDAGGNKDPDFWLRNHLYTVQIPISLIALIVILDKNLLLNHNN